MTIVAEMAIIPVMHVMAILVLMATMAVMPISTVMAATTNKFSYVGGYGNSCSYK